MGKSYKIQCKHCGTQFLQSTESGYGVMPTCIGCGVDDNLSQRVIRCPGCQNRINPTGDDFRQQIIEEISWE